MESLIIAVLLGYASYCHISIIISPYAYYSIDIRPCISVQGNGFSKIVSFA